MWNNNPDFFTMMKIILEIRMKGTIFAVMVCKTMHSSSILLGTSTYWLLVLVLLIMWLV